MFFGQNTIILCKYIIQTQEEAMSTQTEEVLAPKKRTEYRINGKKDILKQREKISKIEKAEIKVPTLYGTPMAIIVRWKCRKGGEAKNFPLVISTENFSEEYQCSPDSVKVSFIGRVGQLKSRGEIELLAKTLKAVEDDFIVLGKAEDKLFASKICSMSNKTKQFVRKDEIMEFIRNSSIAR
jgi:hypothetical protein